MKSFKMEVSKREGQEYKLLGDVTVFYPLLNEMGITVNTDKEDEAGFPVYEDEKHQYLFDTMLAGIKAQARNKLISGTVQLKPNNKIAETVEELLAAAERNGEALKIRREFLTAFKNFLPSTGKSAAFQAAMYDLISTPKVIPLQSQERKDKIIAMITAFAGTLTEETATKFEKYLLNIDESCKAVDALME